MSQINRTGTFRFQAVDAGIGETKNEYPQWIAQLQAVEYYDGETEQWIDWAEYAENEITCYMVLFGGDGNPTLNAKQLQKALGWSGASLQELCIEHIEGIKFQGRVEEHIYEGTTSLRVNWIDTYDAEPGRTLQKLETDDIQKLNAKYAVKLRDLSGGTKPKSVPSVNKESVKAAAKEKLAAQKARGEAAEAKAAEIEKPKPPKAPKPAPKKQAAPEACDKGQAWIDCCNQRDKSVDNKKLEGLWFAAVEQFGGEDEVEEKGLWAAVRDTVLGQARTEIPF